MIGGYALVDCTGLELSTAEEQNIPGLFKSTQEAYNSNKLILACNCNWYGGKMSPIAVRVNLSGGACIASTSTYHVIILPNDVVTVVNDLATTKRSNKKSKEEKINVSESDL